MKKLIALISAIFCVNCYADQLDPIEYREKFAVWPINLGLGFPDSCKAVHLINKIQKTEDVIKKETLLTMLELELDDLETIINHTNKKTKEFMEKWDECYQQNKFLVDENEKLLQIIAEWREKYLG